MIRSPKAKGRKFEHDVAKWLTGIGITARRQPGSGAIPGFPCDTAFQLNGGEFLASCKKRAALPKTFDDWLGGANILVMAPNYARPDDYRVYMTGEFFAWLVRQARAT